MRRIDLIILHCTATEYGRDYTTDEMARWWPCDWREAGYHLVIHPDGRIERLTPLERVSNGCKGHNAHAINIAYIGGLLRGIPTDTRTPQQSESLRKLVNRLLSEFGLSYRNVYGHNEFANKACPCFDVRKEVQLWQNSIGAN